MSLEQAYFVSQITAAIIVVVSILFLAVQLRQNTRVMERTMMEDFRRASTMMFFEVAKDREFAEFFINSGSAYSAMDETDKFRAEFSALGNISVGVQTIRARNAGYIKDDEWNDFVARMKYASQRENIKVMWNRTKGTYSKDIQEIWDQIATG